MTAKISNQATIRITQRDVAKAAGVRQSTVSAALRGTGNISPKVRRQIKDVCDQLGYVSNANAAALRNSASDLIGVVTSPLSSPYHALLVHHISQKLEAMEYRILLSIAGGSEARQRRSVMDLLDQRAAGVIVCTEHPALLKHVEQTLEKKIPMAMIGPSDNGSNIGCDLSEGGFIAGKHLVDMGRKKLVYLVDNPNHSEKQYKAAGFKKAMAASSHFCWAQPLTIPPDVLNSRRTAQATDQILLRFPDVDGIFAHSDAIALPLMRHLLDRGKRIPEDIAVVGFDDIPAAQYSAIPLTTIAQPIEQYANRAIEMLFNQIENLNSSGRAGVSPAVSAQQKTNSAKVPVAESRAPQIGTHFSRASQIQPQPPGSDIPNKFKCQLIVRQSTDPNWAPNVQQAFNKSLSRPEKLHDDSANFKTLKERKKQ